MASFWSKIFKPAQKKREYKNLTKGVDPNEIWEICGELGDGTFGKVYKVKSSIFPLTCFVFSVCNWILVLIDYFISLNYVIKQTLNFM